MTMAQVDREVTGWVGWVYFASMMMLILGGLQAINGLVAIFHQDFFVAGPHGLVVFNYTAWGWLNLFYGLILMAAGAALTTGRMWARVVASILVVLSAIANLAYLPAYPIWSIIALVIDGLVLYALTVHGSEVRAG
jgi:hypothetical protein